MKNKNRVFIIIMLVFAVFLTACTKPTDTEVNNEVVNDEAINDEAVEVVNDVSEVVEEFTETSGSHYIGYITRSNYEDLIYMDKVEFLGFGDEERLKELNIDPDTLDNGYYIHNLNSDLEELNLSEKTEYKILNWEDLSNHKDITHSDFMEFLDGENSYNSSEYLLFHVYTKDGYVTKLEEQYIP